MKLYYEAFVRLLYPATCGGCTALLELDEKALCSNCRCSLLALRFPIEESVLKEPLTWIDEGWTLYPYESPVKEILTGIKFSRKRWLVRTFEEEIDSFFGALASETGYDFLIPIPLDHPKHFEREFNQSELIANLIEKTSGVRTNRRVLAKHRSTLPQSQLSREERLTNLKDAFQVYGAEKIRGKNLLLVDDILTTGATSSEAARILKNNGAKRVDIFTLARTQIPSGGNSL